MAKLTAFEQRNERKVGRGADVLEVAPAVLEVNTVTLAFLSKSLCTKESHG